jgi:hypothetical protein
LGSSQFDGMELDNNDDKEEEEGEEIGEEIVVRVTRSKVVRR